MDSQEWLLGGYWFFRDLLAASFISLFALKIIKRENLLIANLLIVSIVLKYIDIHPSEIVSRFFLDSAFFVTGYQIRKNITLIESRLYLAWPCLLIVILGSVLSPASLAYFEWWQIPHFYVCAFAGSIMALLFSKWLSGISLERLKRSMVYIGNRIRNIAYFTATISISTNAPFGKAEDSTTERAGNGFEKYSEYMLLNLPKLFMSLMKTVDFTTSAYE